MPRFQILGGAHHRPEIPTTPLKPRDPVTMPRSDLDRGGKECRGRVPRNRPARAANRRYLEFLSAIDDPSNGIDKLNRIMRTVHEEARSYRGFNFFDQDDEALFLALARGEFTISGVQNKALRRLFPQFSSGQMSRIIRRLRTHGLIKKASHCYKYYLTALGKQVVALGLKLKELVIIPALATAPCR